MSALDSAAVEMDARRRMLITASVMLASIMQGLDNTIANVALPRIQGSLSATQDQMAWVLTSYIIAVAIMTPLSGWLAGRIGRKKIFVVSVAGFTAASMLCGLAESLPQMVAARFLQGLSGAALIPMSQATLLDINPPSRQARAMSIWVMGTVVGPIIGPALGGWLTEDYNWRWVFYINVPFGILALLGILASMPETATRRSRFDFFGFTTLSIAVGSLQLFLDRGQIQDWFNSREIWVECSISLVAFYLFIVHTLTTREAAFVSPALFKDRNFLAGNVFIAVVGVVLFATLALLPPLLQDLLNYPVVTTGLLTAPRGLGTFIAMFAVGRLVGRLDGRVIIAAGFGLTALASWQMTGFDLQMGPSPIFWSGLMQGVGTGLVYVPLTTAAFGTLAASLRNEGTAVFSLSRNLGSSIGISVVETLLTRNTQIVHAALGAHVSRFNPLAQLRIPGDASAMLHALGGLNASVTAQAAMIAYDDDFKLMMILSLAAIPLVFLMRMPRGRAEAVAIE